MKYPTCQHILSTEEAKQSRQSVHTSSYTFIIGLISFVVVVPLSFTALLAIAATATIDTTSLLRTVLSQFAGDNKIRLLLSSKKSA